MSKSLINRKKVTIRGKKRIERKTELDVYPLLGLAIGIEKSSYKERKTREITILFLCFVLRLTKTVTKESNNEL